MDSEKLSQDQQKDIKVYNATTIQKKQRSKKHRDKSDLGEDFVAPDGGWAWLVCIAAGISNLSLFPTFQQFGFLFRDRLSSLGFNSSEVTTVINVNAAVSACTGLLNGPMFRRFTFRQVALAGSFFIFVGTVFLAFADSFTSFILSYSIILGFGAGISISASSLAINTYFKNKRRRAAGFSWTITGSGTIFFPYIVTFLVSYYGVTGTVLILAGISLHTVVSGLIYQPVLWHTKPKPKEDQEEEQEPEHVCEFCRLSKRKNTGIFSSQYLYKDDDEDKPGFEITDPGTPMLSRANDGIWGSKMSLSSQTTRPRFRKISSSRDIEANNGVVGGKLTGVISQEELRHESFLKPNNFNREREDIKKSTSKLNLYIPKNDDVLNQKRGCTCAEERALLEKESQLSKPAASAESVIEFEKMPFYKKVVAFFDLSLLKDFTYVNLVAGLTFINFGEMNFSILTPFILHDYGLTNRQISIALSLLGSMDITVRFLVPFVTEKIQWDNRVFFLIAVTGTALGRTMVACTRSYPVILFAFVWIGISKGVRTIFWPLIIPGYVPLKRLPAASGLQLLISGIFTFSCGPFVGLIRDIYSYSATLHFLNAMTFIAAISWTLEALIRRHQRKQKNGECDEK